MPYDHLVNGKTAPDGRSWVAKFLGDTGITCLHGPFPSGAGRWKQEGEGVRGSSLGSRQQQSPVQTSRAA